MLFNLFKIYKIMSRIYTDNDTGSWYTLNTNGDGGYTQVNIIEFSDGFARTVGTNIPIEEFQQKYKRIDEISIGPWADLNPAAFGTDLLNDVIVEPVTKDVQQISNDEPISVSIKSTAIQESNDSPEHQLIRNAIKLSKNTSDVTIPVNYTIPFDLRKLKTIMSTMEIESDVIVNVLIENIKQHPEAFFIAIEKAFIDMLNEPESRSV